MRLLHYPEIQNFKRFGDRQRIELDHPAVLIGPNNCGKTTAMQAIALWSQALATWHDSKGQAPPRKRTSTSLNRLGVVSVRVQRTRYFWHNMHVRSGNRDIPLLIAVGVAHEGGVQPVELEGVEGGFRGDAAGALLRHARDGAGPRRPRGPRYEAETTS